MATRSLQEPLPAWQDSAVDRVLWGDQSLPGVVSKSGRKQHRSCDQCRKGKKGCDAIILKDFGNDLADNDAEGGWGRGTFPLGPCSNCTKTGKDCTFVWLFSQERDRLRRTNNGPGPSSKRVKLRATGIQSAISSLDGLPSDGARERLNIFSASSSSPKRVRRGGRGQSEHPSVVSHDQSARPPALQWDFDEISEEDSVFESPETFSSLSPSWNRRTSYGKETCQPPPISNFVWSEPFNPEPFHDEISEEKSNSMGYSSSAASGVSHIGKTQTGTSRQTKRPIQTPVDISPFSIPENLATFTNKSLMTESLMKVYHDSMENALSCWLTERTCPYGSRALTSNGAGSIDPSMLREWGPDWSNRICKQVINLDRKFAVIQDRPLTRSEEKAASNALNLAIMAFATQWSQSSDRSRGKFQPVNTNENPWERSNDLVNDEAQSPGYAGHHVDDFMPPAMEFDRIIQETLWAQARRAIQDATHIESFRVVFAHIIFALTQRPLNIDQHFPSPQPKARKASSRSLHTTLTPESEDNEHSDSASEATDREEHSRLIADIEDVIDQDGPPIFLEQGLRHIHALRCKVEGGKARRWKSKDESGRINPGVSSTSAQLTREDRKTVDLLYWLGVMFDTLSAAIHKRPLVVSDEDSDVHLEEPPKPNCLRRHGLSCEDRQTPSTKQQIPDRLMSTNTSKLWSSFFFQDQALRNGTPPIRWPCSYQSAATALADAAPIKVLLFRKVTRIQTLMLRHIHGEQLEGAIKDALQVHQYWNALYGPFILDCVAHHDQLPARIQSWYICLTGHWHLAVLLLADIIQIIDTDGQLGLESHRRWRESCGLVTALRQRTSHAVADLARCSCPREDASFPDAGEFHFAVNQGALLTEPWTQVLIRVFAKAGALLLADAAISKYRTDPEKSCKQALKRSESCAEALWYLGRKSDMAFLAAKVLTEALKDAREKIVTAEKSQISEEWLEPRFSVDDDFSFSALSAEIDGFAQTSGDTEFGLLEEDTMQNFHVGLMGVDDFESFI
ncbi:hypothetical protein L207DRAFT_628548 [Hyaloscypha variabilis F]|uniref:Zn(2)-C6 fungal-type domain-containing protein n=2 Tax=Hyaloscypha variabilis (strain UAMH 11265 / GT02V1 / F) TaxID=1149755 RepID=A0A2J6S541_HYAVF|nr:hypothetical protein L207DRAFT_628548 [Hyaloscypha variabilis F]